MPTGLLTAQVHLFISRSTAPDGSESDQRAESRTTKWEFQHTDVAGQLWNNLENGPVLLRCRQVVARDGSKQSVILAKDHAGVGHTLIAGSSREGMKSDFRPRAAACRGRNKLEHRAATAELGTRASPDAAIGRGAI